jgi:exopolyphosphatase/guanosine-5'-triphosphate,3'-diphosphate pyrophosphatase
MRIGLIDIGSNTARLLVADVVGESALPIDRAKVFLRLGAEIERRGRIRSRKIAETADVAAAFATQARRHGLERAEVLVTAPGRQTREPEVLTRALASATDWPVRVLGHREEGSLAFDGAVAAAGHDLPEVVGVVDVGGGSTEICVGTPLLGAGWVHSLDVGSLRLTRRLLASDPPTWDEIGHARDLVRRALREVAAPRPDVALAVGGTARALARSAGERLDVDAIDAVVAACAGRSVAKTARALELDPARAATLVGGAILLGEVARLLDRDLRVVRGGVREGAALALAHAEPVAHAA